ncbi:MAG: VOC family protein [Saprospiraceae bacterium]
MSIRLNQITIQVQDVEQSIAFYEKLGLTLIVKNLPSYARFECAGGEATFSLHQTEGTGHQENGAWIYFETEDVDATVQQLMEQGIVFEALPEDKPWLWREARLKDLDHNQLIIYHAGAHRKNPPWRI